MENSSSLQWPFMARNPTTLPNTPHQNPNLPSPIGEHDNVDFLLSRDLYGMNPMDDYEHHPLQYPSVETLINQLNRSKIAIDDSFYEPSMDMGLNFSNKNFAAAMNPYPSDDIDFSMQLQRRMYADQSRYKHRHNNIANRNSTRIHSRLQYDDHVNDLLSSSYNHEGVRPRHRLSSYASLQEFKGLVNAVAKEQQGYRFLLRKVEEKKMEDVEMICSEVKHDLHALMVNQFATYLIQKLVEACSEEQITELVLALLSDEAKLMDVCVHSQGTRAVQKLLEHVKTQQQKSLFVSSLKSMTVSLSKNMHGHHIIQQCFGHFSVEETKPLLDEIVENCPHLATDKSGCCVLQQCLALAEGETLEQLIVDITANAFVLSEHPYGNYVVQYMLKLQISRVTAAILEQLGGSYVNLSMNKYGSNVVQKCLEESTEEQSSKIIKELTQNPVSFLKIVQDPFGNYVVQSALQASKGGVRDALFSLIQFHYPVLSCHPYGKKVLAKTRENKHRVQQACRLWR